MKNLSLPTLLLLLLMLNACHKEKPQYTVTHKGLEKYNNRMVYLSRMSADLVATEIENGFPALDSAIVVNGEVTFTGPEDTLHLYVIQTPDKNYTGFIAERGKLTITNVSEEDGIGGFRYETCTPNSKNKLMHDIVFNPKTAPETIRQVMFNNIGNILGCYLLNMYAQAYPEELSCLYEHSNLLMKDHIFVLQSLNKQLNETREINCGDPFIDFNMSKWYTGSDPKKDTLKNDSIRFADIAGQGKPVSLLFACNPNEKNKFICYMRGLQERYSDIQFVVVTLYYNFAESRQFVDQLSQDFNAIILDDSQLFEKSIRWTYRIRTYINYAYTFDADGRLLSKEAITNNNCDSFPEK